MEELMKELIESVNKLNSFSWTDFFTLFSLICSWITIAFLIKDRLDEKRPYLQITFELVRSNLACVVLRNVGKVPLEIKDINFDENFVNQLPPGKKKSLKDKKLNKIKIFPNKQWIISLDVIIPDILEKYKFKELQIEYSYSKIGSKKIYDEEIIIDFTQYSKFLVYISEINELMNQNKKIESEIKETNMELKKIHSSLVKFHDIEDRIEKSLVNGHTIEK